MADWQDQASKMAEVYGNAFLTIAAAGATDKQEACFIHRSPTTPTSLIPLNNTTDSTTISARSVHRASGSLKNSLDDRAWAFQEAVLSQRLLVYGKTEVSYICKSGEQAEWLGKGDIPLPRNAIKLRGPVTFPRPCENEIDHQEATAQWCCILEFNFCGRSITSESDILPALSGVTHRFQTSLGGNYYAGIWEVDILRGLLLKCRNVIPQGKGIFLKPRIIYCAPSWSWAALHGSIWYGITSHHNKRWTKAKELNLCSVEILDIQTTLVGPSYDPMGQVLAGFIRLCAPIRSAVVVSKSMNKFREERKNAHGTIWV